MATASKVPNTGVAKAHLTEPTAVIEYTKTTPLGRVVDVRKQTGGSINFVYRLFLDQYIEKTQQKTAILKYSAPYASSDQAFKLYVERQIFETRALKYIPWKVFSYPSTLLDIEGNLCSRVTLPELYFDDPGDNVIIMQDMAEVDETWRPERTGDSLQAFCEQFNKAEKKNQTSRAVGSMLGAFFAQLHDWGRRPESHARAEELFGSNNEAVRLILEVHTTAILENMKRAGYEISQDKQRVLVAIMDKLEQSVYQQRDTIVLIDVRPASAILSFDKAERLSNISIIDWEFAAIGPTFLDLSNLVAELFYRGYTTRIDSTYVDVLDSFINAYRAFGGSISLKEMMGSTGASIVDMVGRHTDPNGSQETTAISRECLELALDFIFDAESTDFTLSENDPFAMLSKILKDCLRKEGKSL
ncbi:hypothetical protein MMC10_009974 [Thelotrema lepadinum]|nr:hypothetical protein [Thelotrema lepadinum]